MAAKLTLLEDEWTRQPIQSVRNLNSRWARNVAFAAAPDVDLVTGTRAVNLVSGVTTYSPAGKVQQSGSTTDGGCYFPLPNSSPIYALEEFVTIFIVYDDFSYSNYGATICVPYDNVNFQSPYYSLFFGGDSDGSYAKFGGAISGVFRNVVGLQGWWQQGRKKYSVTRNLADVIFYGEDGSLSSSYHLGYTQKFDITRGSPLMFMNRSSVSSGEGRSGRVALAVLFNKVLSPPEIRSLHANPWQIFEPEEIPLFKPVVTAQYARPIADVSAGGWTASTGSDLYAMLDETSANDGDYITTTSASTCEVALGSLSDPALSTGHIVRYRISATGGGIIVRLREGSTTIASWTHNPAPASPTTYAQTLSGGEADSITSYSALKLQFEAIA